MSRLLDEAVAYFKQERGFNRLLQTFIRKYRSLGRVGGTANLRSLTIQEKEAFSLFFREDFSRKNSAAISVAKFESALQRTKFAGLDVKDILDQYHGQPIRSKAEEETDFLQEKEQYFEKLLKEYPHPHCQIWLNHIVEKKAGTRGIHTTYSKDHHHLLKQLKTVLKAISNLPDKEGYERLPLFASRVAGDPHAFDLNTESGKLFIHALQVIRIQLYEHLEDESTRDMTAYADESTQSTTSYADESTQSVSAYADEPSKNMTAFTSAFSAEHATDILQNFHIVRDDIQNFVTCAGLIGYDRESNEPVPLWKTAYVEGNVLNVPLRELVHVERCLPGYAYKNPVVFVVENSGVFSSILDYFSIENATASGINNQTYRAGRTYRRLPPLICTHGQFRLATLLLLDKLVANSTTIYYSGDFDPEGIGMAARLYHRHPAHVKLWRYGLGEYVQFQSEIELDDTRLNKLNSIIDPVFEALIEQMKSRRKIVYQEQFIELLIHDISII